MQYKLTASAENSVMLTVTDGGKEWEMSVSRSYAGLSIHLAGNGVTDEEPAWLLNELALLMPPQFVDCDEHETALSEAL
ncbi:hypothetical protein ACN2XU_24155 [Primorskyibacter sp. 2E107]|uniref:hypothetical protein n=1 Tax=Primorskyibacter sp. 2E107 TaxID=3403458 RepID=UPI003AF919BF